jgi:hypothetical protein
LPSAVTLTAAVVYVAFGSRRFLGTALRAAKNGDGRNLVARALEIGAVVVQFLAATDNAAAWSRRAFPDPVESLWQHGNFDWELAAPVA